MPTNKGQTSKSKKKTVKTTKSVGSSSKVAPKKSYSSVGKYDSTIYLSIAGIIGLVLSYTILSRALNTGSYWEYFFGIAFLIIAIRLFIRSIRLK